MNGWEIAFAIYTCGWTLDRFATTVSAACTRQRIESNLIYCTIPLVADASQLEHGWRVFAANLWNGLDAVIIL
jgi:hypothetical protein